MTTNELAARYELRRGHDGTTISQHCSLPCGQHAIETVTLRQLMGERPPGPLEWVEGILVDLVADQPVMFTRSLVPLDGRPPAEILDYK